MFVIKTLLIFPLSLHLLLKTTLPIVKPHIGIIRSHSSNFQDHISNIQVYQQSCLPSSLLSYYQRDRKKVLIKLACIVTDYGARPTINSSDYTGNRRQLCYFK